MRRTTRLLSAVAVVAAVTGVSLAPRARAASTAKLTPTVAAWYQPNPTCTVVRGCVPLPSLPVDVPLSPYPAGTSHVAVAGGEELARSFLGFTYPPAAGTLLGATLDLPVDTAAGSGTALPDAADLLVCLTTTTVAAVAGSTAEPPAVSCEGDVRMSYAADPAPRLSADLGPLAPRLLAAKGLAIIPDALGTSSSDVWHVAFQATAPVLTLRFGEARDDSAADTTVPDVAPPALDAEAPPAAPSAPSDVVVPAVPATARPTTSTPSEAPTDLEPPTETAAPVAAIGAEGYAYPLVFVLPFLFAIGFALAGRSLTRDLTPPDPPPADRL